MSNVVLTTTRPKYMPLSPKMSVGKIIHELKTKGKRKRSRKQMVAIALAVKRRNKQT